MAKETQIWEFIEKYYPDYSGADEIAYNRDLYKLVKKEYEEGDCAHDLLGDDYDGDINNPQILIDYNTSLVKIYEAAIEEFINTGML